jgi:hypothetical protein
MHTKYSNVFYEPDEDDMIYHTGFKFPIAFDMDSVLTNGTWLRHYVAKHFGMKLKDVAGHHKKGYEVFYFGVPGADHEEVGRVVDRGILEESPSALPSPYMAEVTQYVYNVTHSPILVVTARAEANIDVTWQWLHENLTVPFIVYMVKGHGDKAKLLAHHDVKIFIDDRHKTVRNLVNVIPYPVMYQQPWNQGRDPISAIEIRDLRDIIPVLNLQLGRVPMEWPGTIPYPKPHGERITKKYATIV